ncbi:transcriptional regulator [Campylobacter sp. MIT 99-7217]|uniref:transcriptional regulator n=1 Tax=Campylobacter sp. MIT 99-7217 TaxID=535091 RepID=UPI001157A649|nr:transcriptional regulator [Campylobacter sp. MIT 99-7217]TQR34556.1 transcriptional regulator [Campylobacter sp. MIT 99-7217]
MAKKTKRDMAYHLDVDVSTLYNWRKYKPNLYRIVMLGFKFDELLEQSKKNYEDLLNLDELIKDEIQKFKN